jgi:two-component system chemotaxis response regulator CheY
MSESSLSNIRVLLAEDKDQMRKIEKTMLMHLGMRNIVEVADGARAWEELTTVQDKLPIPGAKKGTSRDTFDLIVCDWMMPGLTGLELLNRVRGHSRLTEIPFLMATAQNDKHDVVLAVNSGVTDYIIKPFAATMLEHKIRGILARVGK